MKNDNSKKKVLKKDKQKKLFKKIVKPKKTVKEKIENVSPPYFPPPYFSSNWGAGPTAPVEPVAPTPTVPPYFPPPYFSANWGAGPNPSSNTDNKNKG